MKKVLPWIDSIVVKFQLNATKPFHCLKLKKLILTIWNQFTQSSKLFWPQIIIAWWDSNPCPLCCAFRTEGHRVSFLSIYLPLKDSKSSPNAMVPGQLWMMLFRKLTERIQLIEYSLAVWHFVLADVYCCAFQTFECKIYKHNYDFKTSWDYLIVYPMFLI